ncbi:unnamed protein product [Pieris macdunnoughi]|uniref:DDE Tnp4 domain-containing protein n=1 Tax=Pieris macdunnoughi TaxID=345717 RepID=A0A821MRA8_9NEOP|nr:unnamed protein product [Pieris macdunnoughi]
MCQCGRKDSDNPKCFQDQTLDRNGRLNIPLPSKLPNDQSNYEFPYYFIGDEAFPLLSYLMRPYPQRTLNDLRRATSVVAQITDSGRAVAASGLAAASYDIFALSVNAEDYFKSQGQPAARHPSTRTPLFTHVPVSGFQ